MVMDSWILPNGVHQVREAPSILFDFGFFCVSEADLAVSSIYSIAAAFSSQNCDIRSHFTDHTIVFDLTFCVSLVSDSPSHVGVRTSTDLCALPPHSRETGPAIQASTTPWDVPEPVAIVSRVLGSFGHASARLELTVSRFSVQSSIITRRLSATRSGRSMD